MICVDRLIYQTFLTKKPDSVASISNLTNLHCIHCTPSNRIDLYHTSIRYTCMVVSLLTECTNGNSSFNEPLKLICALEGHGLFWTHGYTRFRWVTIFHTLYACPVRLPYIWSVDYHVAVSWSATRWQETHTEHEKVTSPFTAIPWQETQKHSLMRTFWVRPQHLNVQMVRP